MPLIPAFTIRDETKSSDRSNIFTMLNTSGLFKPREMAYGMDLFDEHLMRGEMSLYRFMFAESGNLMLAYGCYGFIRLSQDSYHLHWLAVDRSAQNAGIGKKLESVISERVANLGGGRIYAETSNREYHTGARAFYQKCGYELGGTVPNYYGDSDDMVFFVKHL